MTIYTKFPINENIEAKLDYFYETKQIPNIIFHGASGTGKKTIIFDFLYKIYDNDKQKLKSNIMIVNCSHGKGIKFIREELKFFAKTNIQTNSGVMFKSIVLLNADSLTNDAQSALRRCIELFSFNTRFFIVVENKHKLLNPILSRFCEIYVPECIQNGKTINLHQFHLNEKFGKDNTKEIFSGFIVDKIRNCKTLHKDKNLSHQHLVNLALEIYENGYSCLDLMNYIEETEFIHQMDYKSNILLCFHKIKLEFRCEKLLILYMLDFMFLRLDTNLKNVSFI
jgi:hypothetical protein